MDSVLSAGRANRPIAEILGENDTLRAASEALRSRLAYLESQRVAQLEYQVGTGLESRLEARLEARYETRLAQLESRLQARVETHIGEILKSQKVDPKQEFENTPGLIQLGLDACNLVLKAHSSEEASMIELLGSDASIKQRNVYFNAVLGLERELCEYVNMLQFKPLVARIFAKHGHYYINKEAPGNRYTLALGIIEKHGVGLERYVGLFERVYGVIPVTLVAK